MAIIDGARTVEEVRRGLLNGVFKHPSLISTHLHKIFSDADISLSNITDNSFIVTCISYEWVKEKYNRRFHITFVSQDNGFNRIIRIEEI